MTTRADSASKGGGHTVRITYSAHQPGRLYHHQTDGGAEYLCTKHIAQSDEGDLLHAAVRLDGGPELLGCYLAAPDLLRELAALVNWVYDNIPPSEKAAAVVFDEVSTAKLLMSCSGPEPKSANTE